MRQVARTALPGIVAPMTWVLVGLAVVGVLLLARFVRSLDDVHALARGGHAHRLRALVEQDRDRANAKNADGETPLHHAAKHGAVEAIRVLLAYGADPNAKTPIGATPLHMARAFGEEAAAKALLDAGADPGSAPAFVNLGDGDLVTALPDDDPDMLRAALRAKEALPTLRELARERPGHAAVKFAFTTDANTTEHLWADLLELGESTMRVRVRTKPATHEGDFALEQERPIADVEDWQVEMADGTIRGGFGFGPIFAKAKKDLGALPPGLAEHEHRFVDLRG